MLTVRRTLALGAVLCLGLAAPAGAAVDRQSHGIDALLTLRSQVLGDVNALRLSHHLRPLRLSLQLTAAADFHSLEMARRGFFAHESANGSPFWKRVLRFYQTQRYRYWSVGENLLWSSPDVDHTTALKMWLGSPEHRANLLEPRWREIGLSAVHAVAAPGVFGGQPVTIVTADFGVRR